MEINYSSTRSMARATPTKLQLVAAHVNLNVLGCLTHAIHKQLHPPAPNHDTNVKPLAWLDAAVASNGSAAFALVSPLQRQLNLAIRQHAGSQALARSAASTHAARRQLQRPVTILVANVVAAVGCDSVNAAWVPRGRAAKVVAFYQRTNRQWVVQRPHG